jgi:hypothetical protein
MMKKWLNFSYKACLFMLIRFFNKPEIYAIKPKLYPSSKGSHATDF